MRNTKSRQTTHQKLSPEERAARRHKQSLSMQACKKAAKERQEESKRKAKEDDEIKKQLRLSSPLALEDQARKEFQLHLSKISELNNCARLAALQASTGPPNLILAQRRVNKFLDIKGRLDTPERWFRESRRDQDRRGRNLWRDRDRRDRDQRDRDRRDRDHRCRDRRDRDQRDRDQKDRDQRDRDHQCRDRRDRDRRDRDRRDWDRRDQDRRGRNLWRDRNRRDRDERNRDRRPGPAGP